MTAIIAHFRRVTDLGVALGELRRKLPGLSVTTEDWFLTQRQQAIATFEKLQRECPTHILEDIDRAEARAGPRKGIALPVSGSVLLDGSVGPRGMLLACKTKLEDPEIAQIRDALENTEIVGEIEIMR
jgi:hypothetical protein